MPHDPQTVTRLIIASRDGDDAARHRLFEIIYDELRTIARSRRFVGHHGDTMQPTALVNEVFLQLDRRLPVPPRDRPDDRRAFFASVALAMRTILRDDWRRRSRKKRGGAKSPALLRCEPVDVGTPLPCYDRVDFLALDEAIDRLKAYNESWAEVVTHRYFGGRSIEETAELMGVGRTTVKAYWDCAKMFLHRELGDASHDQ